MTAEAPQESRFGEIRAVLFDLDGVLTPTVDIHVVAWAKLFEPFLAARGVVPAYSDDDYYRYIDGRPRVDGVRALLASRDIVLPEGTPDDSPLEETVWGLGLRKNDEFFRILDTVGVVPYPGSVAFLDATIASGRAVAVVSSSRNAVSVLIAAQLSENFAIVVDGMVADATGLPGKPAPDTFVYAADLLGLPVSECAVIEDAHSGVQAARAGDFGLVVGVDRGVGAQGLYDSGADIVVSDLAELVSSISEPAISKPAISEPAITPATPHHPNPSQPSPHDPA
ncbi:HAD family hydrolase [Subtercola frigoramans]|uniref:HAD superfamily hydrolase (TIGR01509 family) n=1 Tax=Subtercola frigoramans TaxID=120298 RepID=A0ABS2L9D4_9MICO|nr:HAD-IA family hydrolase [Subtercola frigoramans]MBM7473056.1 HAD superfamily hydrolase (TIGR01509 family) [Subtercola frigoramans]